MIKTFLKVLFAGILIAWLITSDRLDLTYFYQLKKYPLHVVAALILIFMNICITGMRWNEILKLKISPPLKPLQYLKFTWIGLFFNLVLPGSVTGDVVKLVYVKKRYPSLTKTFLLISAFLDRFFGLTGLLFLAGILSLFALPSLSSTYPQAVKVLLFNFLFLFGALGALGTFFIKKDYQDRIANLLSRLPLGKNIERAFRRLWELGNHPKVVGKCLTISLFNQACNMTAFFVLALPFIEGEQTLLLLSIIPLGFVTMSIPITPAGLGLGHAAFMTLLALIGIDDGASLFNNFFLLSVFMNLFGLIPFAMTKMSIKDLKLKEASR